MKSELDGVVSCSPDIVVRFWNFRVFLSRDLSGLHALPASQDLYMGPNDSCRITKTEPAPITTGEIKTRCVCAYKSFNIESKIWRRHFASEYSPPLTLSTPLFSKPVTTLWWYWSVVFTKQYFNCLESLTFIKTSTLIAWACACQSG